MACKYLLTFHTLHLHFFHCFFSMQIFYSGLCRSKMDSWVHLLVFASSVVYIFNVISKKWSQRPMLMSYLLCFILKSWVHLKSFCKRCKTVIQFHVLHVVFQFTQEHLLRRLFFPHWVFLTPCQMLVDHKCRALFLGFLFSFIDYVPIFMLV